ncbi:MAG TPA: tetratricopeptide repeat protein [Steroidobacteraceae bacterium]|jgi:cytochrome c-type biogenesis protein CcmH|nr:tetratricopeptide repeat protein [Steroidobacteraceae bacterium]
MATFMVIAAIMAAIAGAAAAWPLLRDRASRAQGALTAVIVVAAAAGLYPLWSNWNWHAPAGEGAPGPDVGAMVAKLEKRLHDQPNDLSGWLMLGRSYLALERVDGAVAAFSRARELDANSAEAALGLGEALSLKAGAQITPQAGELFETALRLAPRNPKALLYGGFAAAVRGDRALARERWETLKGFHPPDAVVRLLDARIAELDSPDSSGGSGSDAAATGPSGGPPAGTIWSGAGTSTSAGASSGGQVAVNITLAPNLKSKLTSESSLFVFAREPGSQGPPLAVKRLTTAAIGSQVRLSSADSMMPGRVLTAGQRVTLTARVSFSGQPMPSQGDLYGELSYEVGQAGKGNLVIDRIVP